MSKNIRLKIFASLFFLLFFIFEYVFPNRIESINAHALFIFEIIWVAGILIVFQDFNWFNKKKILRWLSLVALTGVLGAWVQIFAFSKGITVPFDYESGETLLLLLLVGPVIEEFLFRLGVWKVFETFFKNKWVLILISAMLFSFSHYRVIFAVPVGFYTFVKYQTLYTFVLGLVCGYLRVSYGMISAILAHLLFNFGFWLAR